MAEICYVNYVYAERCINGVFAVLPFFNFTIYNVLGQIFHFNIFISPIFSHPRILQNQKETPCTIES